ncbi:MULTISPECIES: hypothetical protein [unclassified Mesorhizobium]|uniref:hypothetical protein n=1 Tax=unclassified Mesorhizobium TaxID=325217 RepID=UPI00112721B6|nr:MULTISPECIES: hypothetical protein [unclassified Mesorhizobium]TPK42290.1 hypothetical protein FJ550_30100 [Mesorhizobium sp. B2-5-2]TPL44515.1 hypothetical protein FJ961_04040 [Mesorhizobium sp. B2-4-5]TPM68702.1 hypothetical protein FJ968_29845 [Mesorhizobium sp. B2-1-6]TPN71738.1 hypothetical protein FJ985_30605 [Mesorhizobium sp. B1-1-2]
MAKFLVTYDLKNTTPSPYVAFRDAAIKLGWAVWQLTSDGNWYRLPNTTLIGEFPDMAAADKSFDAIKPAAEKVLGHPITLEKEFLVLYSGSLILSDQKQAAKKT